MRTILPLLLLQTAAVLGGMPAHGGSSQDNGGATGPRPRLNIARGCAVTFGSKPNYALCVDPEDPTQLTDGKYVEGHFWTQAGTVGWQAVSPVVITIDLGKSQPLSGVSYSTAAGIAGVYWPTSILIGVSDDSKSWRYVGDLVSLSAANGSPLPADYGTYSLHRFTTDELRTRGRYVQLDVFATATYTFCDEIEVYRGSDDLRPTGLAVSSLSEYGQIEVTRRRIATRLTTDMETISHSLDASALSEPDKSELHARLDDLSRRIPTLPDPDASFRAVLPLNDLHEEILAANGRLMHLRGLPPLTAWHKHRYDPISPMEIPSIAASAPSVSIEMMGNEYRSDALLLTNSTERAIDARIEVVGMPDGPRPEWLSVSPVALTDTSTLTTVAAALPDARYAEGAYSIVVPAGMTRKVWLTVDSSKLDPGAHMGSLMISGGGHPLKLPFELRVSPVKMARPRLSLGMWDYTDGGGERGMTPRNIPAAIKLMRSHFVDTPWASGRALPMPGPQDFDSSNALMPALDFTHFDSWVRKWPRARNYYVFPNVGDTFAGARIGTPDFDARVRVWARALADHMRILKLNPKQLGLLLVDEPFTDSQDAIIAAWARAIKASGAGITLWEDPIWERPDLARTQDAITLIDVLCPNLSTYYTGGPEVGRYFEHLRASGHPLWFYMCDGPTRTLDPDGYFRRMAWYAFRHGAVGIGFWAFGDAGGGNSWNEYASRSTSFTPVFISPDSVTNGIHWQAVREGIEDYEYLSMLRQAADRSKDDRLAAQARSLLDEAVTALTPPFTTRYQWKDESDRTLADTYRLRVLNLLEKMR